MNLNLHESPIESPGQNIGEDETTYLLEASWLVLSRVIDRPQPKWLLNEAVPLVNRLEEILAWHRLQ